MIRKRLRSIYGDRLLSFCRLNVAECNGKKNLQAL